MSRPVRRARRPRDPKRTRSAWLLAPPTMEDLIRVLSAWRMWILGGLLAAALGAAVHVIAPPRFRAQATVNVDFHLEQAWPQSSDREQFYYLERETRKLVEIAMSDEVLEAVTHEVPGVTIQDLRAGAAQLSQPGNGGWHFFGIDPDPQRAAMIASSWARAFSNQVAQQVMNSDAAELEQFITADLTQVTALHSERSAGVGAYMLASVIALLTIMALMLLLIHPKT
jgi:hypothetical protein